MITLRRRSSLILTPTARAQRPIERFPSGRGTMRERAVVRSFGSSTRFRFIFFSNAVGGRDLWSDWKNGIYIGSVAIGVLLPLFFFVVRP